MALSSLERLQPIWRLGRSLGPSVVTVTPAPTAENLLSGIIHVGEFNRIRFRVVGEDANDETGSMVVNGYAVDGIRTTVATFTVVLGNKTDHEFTNPLIWRDDLIRSGLTGTVFEADTYTETFDQDAGGIATSSTQEVDGYNYVDLDLSKGQYSWIQLRTTLTTAASLGVIWLPVQLKTNFGNLAVG